MGESKSICVRVCACVWAGVCVRWVVAVGACVRGMRERYRGFVRQLTATEVRGVLLDTVQGCWGWSPCRMTSLGRGCPASRSLQARKAFCNDSIACTGRVQYVRQRAVFRQAKNKPLAVKGAGRGLVRRCGCRIHGLWLVAHSPAEAVEHSGQASVAHVRIVGPIELPHCIDG